MVSTDPIADMLSRIRNAIAVGQAAIELPHSSIKEDLGRLLVKNGFLWDAKSSTVAGRKMLQITINDSAAPPTITEVKRLSRPGRRHYVRVSEIPTVKRGRGLVIISTSQGLMTGIEAKAKKMGGELICEVY